jgi:uncharacterized protein (TIGR02246 family)
MTTLPPSLQTLLDRSAIAELTAHYNDAFDANDGGRFAGTFVADGEMLLNGASLARGADALAALAARPAGTVHYTTDAIVEVDGDRATQRCRLLLCHLPRDARELRLDSSGSYADELVRTAEGWRFVRRAATLDVRPSQT